MANIYEGMNVRQKLAKARLYFLNQKVEKTGKNMHLEFKYFELEDIVPTALRIFARVGLVSNTVFDGEKATMTIYNTDDLSEEGISYVVPYREVETIVNNQGKAVTNQMQALGSSITYLRRYLWMMALDITEPDDIDANLGADTEPEEEPEIPAPNPEKAKKAKKEKKAPATAAERKAATTKLVGATEQADDLQITALKKACKTLLNKDEEQEDFIQQIAMRTKGFTEVTRSDAETLINYISKMLEEYKDE